MGTLKNRRKKIMPEHKNTHNEHRNECTTKCVARQNHIHSLLVQTTKNISMIE
jgi:hypothetical protein